jgi:hypothetical protein
MGAWAGDVAMKVYSTVEAAKRAGISRITLHRWLAKGVIRPAIGIPMKGQTLWRWTDADVKRARLLKGSFKPGPKGPMKPKVGAK